MNECRHSPALIGAVGGSGTRVVARILARAGFFIGASRNEAEDSVPVMGFFDGWLRTYILSGGAFPPQVAQAVTEDFRRAIADHRHGMMDAEGLWAIKVPRSLLMLAYWNDAFPQLRFIHVIRNGLDMAYSSDNNQLRMFQDVILPAAERDLPRPLRAMAYWRTVNLQAARIGESILGPRYQILRFEDLCREPRAAVSRVAVFLGISNDLSAALREVASPPTIDRWRERPAEEVRSLVDIGRPALERFGYLNSAPCDRS